MNDLSIKSMYYFCKDLSLFPIGHIRQFTTICNSANGDTTPSLDSVNTEHS